MSKTLPLLKLKMKKLNQHRYQSLRRYNKSQRKSTSNLKFSLLKKYMLKHSKRKHSKLRKQTISKMYKTGNSSLIINKQNQPSSLNKRKLRSLLWLFQNLKRKKNKRKKIKRRRNKKRRKLNNKLRKRNKNQNLNSWLTKRSISKLMKMKNTDLQFVVF